MIELGPSSRLLTKSAMQKSLNVQNQEEYISFALGLPANEAIPLTLIQRSANYYNNGSAIQYSPPLLKLKTQIKELVKQRGINCDEEEIFLTSGAQQGISLLTRLLHNKSRIIITEELVYPGFLQIAQSLEANIITISSCYHTGIDLNMLEEKIKASQTKPSLIYTVIDGNNPLSLSLSLKKRKKLVSIAKKYEIPILEDDPYGFLCYQQEQLPALKAIEQDYVCYIGSFSKVIAPALRVGWIIAPKYIIPKLSMLKESTDIDTATFSQRIIYKFIDGGYFEDHLTKVKDLYREKRDLMLSCIKTFLPPSTKCIVPQNGIFLWIELDNTIDTEKLFQEALKKKVIIIPGNAFAVPQKTTKDKNIANNCIRLNFSFSNYEDIEEGVRRIGLAL